MSPVASTVGYTRSVTQCGYTYTYMYTYCSELGLSLWVWRPCRGLGCAMEVTPTTPGAAVFEFREIKTAAEQELRNVCKSALDTKVSNVASACVLD